MFLSSKTFAFVRSADGTFQDVQFGNVQTGKVMDLEAEPKVQEMIAEMASSLLNQLKQAGAADRW